MLLPVLTYGSKTMLWKEKEISRAEAVQMENLRGLLGIKRVDKVPNTWKRGLFGVTKGVDERIDEGILRWFGHVEMIKDRIVKRVHVGEYAGSRSVDRPRIDTVKGCLRKRGLDVREARRMVQDRSKWRRFVSRHSQVMNPRP